MISNILWPSHSLNLSTVTQLWELDWMLDSTLYDVFPQVNTLQRISRSATKLYPGTRQFSRNRQHGLSAALPHIPNKLKKLYLSAWEEIALLTPLFHSTTSLDLLQRGSSCLSRLNSQCTHPATAANLAN